LQLLIGAGSGILTGDANPIQESAVGVGNAGQTPDRANIIVPRLWVICTIIFLAIAATEFASDFSVVIFTFLHRSHAKEPARSSCISPTLLLMGYDESIVHEAENRAAQFTTQGSWEAFPGYGSVTE